MTTKGLISELSTPLRPDAGQAGAVRYAHTMAAFAVMLAVLSASLFLGLCAGRFSVAPLRALEIVIDWVLSPSRVNGGIDERIVLLVRMPRIILAGLSGAGLAVAGVALQAVFRNPLVSPQVLGISPGAAFGGVLAIVLGWWGIPLLGLSFAIGLIALISVGLLARIDGRSEIVTVILAGIVVSALFGALVSLVQFVADPNGSLPAIVYWLMGSMASATWERLALATPGLAIGSLLIFALRFRLNILSLDDGEARSLGARPDMERWLIFAAVTVIVGSQVSVSGVVGWIGLVIPHAVRMIVGQDNRLAVPASAILGASFLIFVDTLARTMTAAEIPLGALTALVGAPVFAILLRRHYRERNR